MQPIKAFCTQNIQLLNIKINGDLESVEDLEIKPAEIAQISSRSVRRIAAEGKKSKDSTIISPFRRKKQPFIKNSVRLLRQPTGFVKSLRPVFGLGYSGLFEPHPAIRYNIQYIYI